MSGNKAKYYGLATQEDKNALTFGGAHQTTGGMLTYAVVANEVRKYKHDHPNFDELSTGVAAQRIAAELNKTDRYGNVTAHGSRIVGDNYSVALTKGRGTGGMITVNHASEHVGEQQKKKKG